MIIFDIIGFIILAIIVVPIIYIIGVIILALIPAPKSETSNTSPTFNNNDDEVDYEPCYTDFDENGIVID